MKRVGDLGGDLQNFGQGLTRKISAKGLVNVIERHTAGQAFEDEGETASRVPRIASFPPRRWGSATIP